MAANITQILKIKADFHQEFELFFTEKIYANNGRHVDNLGYPYI